MFLSFKTSIYFLFRGSIISTICLLVFFIFFSESIIVHDDISLTSIINITLIALSTAFFEEIAFRLYFLNFLIKKIDINWIWALFISSVIFALCHLGNSHISLIALVSHFFGGLIYGIAFLKSKSIFYAIGLHFGWNLTQYLFSLPMSGSLKLGIWEIHFPDNQLFYGDQYGIEGGIASLAVRCCILILLIVPQFLDKYKKNN